MYRNFALISLGLTASIALIADRENRDAVEQEIAEAKNPPKTEASTKTIAKNFHDKRSSPTSFGQEAGPAAASNSGYWDQSDVPQQVAASKVTFVATQNIVLPENAINGLPPGMSQEELRAWQEAQRRKKAQRGGKISEEDSELEQLSAQEVSSTSDVAAIVAASKARSTGQGQY